MAGAAALSGRCGDPALGAAVAAVLADLTNDAVRALGPELRWDGVTAYLLLGGAVVAGAGAPGADRADAVHLIGNVLQDALVEELRAPLPPCAGHPHPMALRRDGGSVAWHCPATGAAVRALS